MSSVLRATTADFVPGSTPSGVGAYPSLRPSDMADPAATRAIKEPRLMDQHTFALVKQDIDSNPQNGNKWRSNYRSAYLCQREQGKAFNVFLLGLMTDKKKKKKCTYHQQKDYPEYHKAFKVFYNTGKDQLNKINRAITKLNGNGTAGLVAPQLLFKPLLQNPGDYEVIQKDAVLQWKLRYAYACAYTIQLLRNISCQDSRYFDQDWDDQLKASLLAIDTAIQGVVSLHTQSNDNRGFGRLELVPNNAPPSFVQSYPLIRDAVKLQLSMSSVDEDTTDTDDAETNIEDDDSDDDSDDEDNEESLDPKKKERKEKREAKKERVKQIYLEELVGHNTLQLLIAGAPDIRNLEETSRFMSASISFNHTVQRVDEASGECRLNIEELADYLNNEDGFALWREYKDTGDQRILAEYTAVREKAWTFLHQKGLPEELLDSIVPPNNELAKLASKAEMTAAAKLFSQDKTKPGMLYEYLRQKYYSPDDVSLQTEMDQINQVLTMSKLKFAPYFVIQGSWLATLQQQFEGFHVAEMEYRMKHPNSSTSELNRLSKLAQKILKHYGPGDASKYAYAVTGHCMELDPPRATKGLSSIEISAFQSRRLGAGTQLSLTQPQQVASTVQKSNYQSPRAQDSREVSPQNSSTALTRTKKSKYRQNSQKESLQLQRTDLFSTTDLNLEPFTLSLNSGTPGRPATSQTQRQKEYPQLRAESLEISRPSPPPRESRSKKRLARVREMEMRNSQPPEASSTDIVMSSPADSPRQIEMRNGQPSQARSTDIVMSSQGGFGTPDRLRQIGNSYNGQPLLPVSEDIEMSIRPSIETQHNELIVPAKPSKKKPTMKKSKSRSDAKVGSNPTSIHGGSDFDMRSRATSVASINREPTSKSRGHSNSTKATSRPDNHIDTERRSRTSSVAAVDPGLRRTSQSRGHSIRATSRPVNHTDALPHSVKQARRSPRLHQPLVIPALESKPLDSEFQATGVNSGKLMGRIYGRYAEQTIYAYRPVGRRNPDGTGYSNQLLLRFRMEDDLPVTYAWVPASEYKTQFKDFVQRGGKRFESKSREIIPKDTLLQDCTIGGVTSQHRDPDKEYWNFAATEMLLKFSVSADAEWFTMTELKKFFGNGIVAEKDRYMQKSKQDVPKEPTLRRKKVPSNYFGEPKVPLYDTTGPVAGDVTDGSDTEGGDESEEEAEEPNEQDRAFEDVDEEPNGGDRAFKATDDESEATDEESEATDEESEATDDESIL